jgi:excisionase family DNA binding protein
VRLTTAEAAQLLGCTRSEVLNKIQRGTLPVAALTRSNGYVLLLADVLRYRARRARGRYGRKEG